ncbi:hypothetical protein COLO4_04120 [Corchorus olitorius]|uniref:BURP domain-containing protein n=1 Tax=Corchorus olitorius TaxID=93759 RepID=A0A1R3KV51_9ROSI|nr:hypothetical protein COLO4_04120 [Corchorus olitorius]
MWLQLALAVSHAALPAELYWKSVFPNTPMPKALRSILPPATAGKQDVLINMAAEDVVDASFKYKFPYDATPSKKFADGEPLTKKFKDIFFFESKLKPNQKINIIELIKETDKATFLPRSVAESIPFSTQNLPEIYKYFSVEAKSAKANILKKTIESCESSSIRGEEKYCATSLESFVDLGVSKLGKNIKLLSTELEKETKNQEFTIGEGIKMMGKSDIVCHKLKYPYAVFYCHSIEKTAVYMVPVVGADGTKAKALAVCHKDTSAWNPNHLSFQILKVQPGTVPICHFLARETLVWISK